MILLYNSPYNSCYNSLFCNSEDLMVLASFKFSPRLLLFEASAIFVSLRIFRWDKTLRINLLIEWHPRPKKVF